MHIEAHATLGWAVGVLTPGTSRRLRNWCLLAAVLPDIDTVSYLFGSVAYANYHHTFGHNVFLGLLVALAAAWYERREKGPFRILGGVLPGICFLAHLLADMKLSAYTVFLFWPLSQREFEFPNNLGLAAPINTALVYGAGATVLALAAWKKITPLNVFSPELDRICVGLFRARTLSCSTCGARCNEHCHECGMPTCLRHGRITWGLRIRCPSCPGEGGGGGIPGERPLEGGSPGGRPGSPPETP